MGGFSTLGNKTFEIVSPNCLRISLSPQHLDDCGKVVFLGRQTISKPFFSSLASPLIKNGGYPTDNRQEMKPGKMVENKEVGCSEKNDFSGGKLSLDLSAARGLMILS